MIAFPEVFAYASTSPRWLVATFGGECWWDPTTGEIRALEERQE